MQIQNSFDRHCTSKDHFVVPECQKKDAMSAYVDSESVEESDPDDTDTQDKALFRTIYFLMKNEIPLNKLDAILDLQRLNGVEMHYQNLSQTCNSYRNARNYC
ncbi:hypothetical protein DPMN_168186 [Dreissena polymorpha]|uniref:Uncharacterized protein n=1 Tax=Dreissena polymorpha TaxID=45954 RepID=A0A9D4IZF1_DREPO|nr:hypothetical protein DPMN_168186 [Dreissena polymorpha]